MGGTNGGQKRFFCESQEDGFLDVDLKNVKIEDLESELARLTGERDTMQDQTYAVLERIEAAQRWVRQSNSRIERKEDEMADVRRQIDQVQREVYGRLRAMREDNADHHRRVCPLRLSVCRLGAQQDPGQDGELLLFGRRHEPIQLHAPEPETAA